MRFVMDANVLVSGIFWSGPPNQILRRWLEGRGILLITAPILAEYREVIERLAEDSELGARWNVLLTEFGEIVPPAKFEAQLCRDKDDEKYWKLPWEAAPARLFRGTRTS